MELEFEWRDANAISLQCQAGFGCFAFTLLFNTRIRKREIIRACSLRSFVQGNAYARLSCIFPAMLYMPGAPGSGLSHRSAQRAQSIINQAATLRDLCDLRWLGLPRSRSWCTRGIVE